MKGTLTIEVFYKGKLIESETTEYPIIDNGINSTIDLRNIRPLLCSIDDTDTIELKFITNKKGKGMKEEKRLTKIKALEICEELWSWLAKTGNGYKDDWPGWNKYGEMENECPCCEYNNQFSNFGEFTCSKCPIKWISEKEKEDFYDCGYPNCQQGPSPFAKWEIAVTPKTRKAAAESMLVLIRKTLRHERSK